MAKITLQESQRTGYPTDVPVKSYNFQAPISNNGEERQSLRRLKLVHYLWKVNDDKAFLLTKADVFSDAHRLPSSRTTAMYSTTAFSRRPRLPARALRASSLCSFVTGILCSPSPCTLAPA